MESAQLTTDEWLKKMWYICTMKYYSAIKMKLSFAGKWMELEIMIKFKKPNNVCSYVESRPKMIIITIGNEPIRGLSAELISEGVGKQRYWGVDIIELDIYVFPYAPAITLLGIYPTELKTYVHTKISTQVFITLLSIAKS
jgi:hypothetical protein